MIDKLQIQDIKQDVKVNYSQIYQQAYIDRTKPLEAQPIALSYGVKFGEHVPLITYGNFMCIVGASKSKKTFLKTALVAGYIGGKAQTYFKELRGHFNSGRMVIDLDTEQSPFHVRKMSDRVISMANETPMYHSFALRPYSSKERLGFIEWLFYESDFKDSIGLCSIDGIADLVENVNDLDKCNEVVQKLMKITEEKKCAMITILHKNFDSDKPTGHLGSAVLKKSETVLFVQNNGEQVSVKPKYSRNISIDEFSFTLNDQALPMEVDNDIF